MDIRKTQGENTERVQRSESGYADFLIKIDSATESRLLNESVVYNLVQKTRSIEEMKALYYKNRPAYDSPYINYMASFVHTGSKSSVLFIEKFHRSGSLSRAFLLCVGLLFDDLQEEELAFRVDLMLLRCDGNQ